MGKLLGIKGHALHIRIALILAWFLLVLILEALLSVIAIH
jgi:hypothetical protein